MSRKGPAFALIVLFVMLSLCLVACSKKGASNTKESAKGP